jgi:hypothetical protein
VKIADLQGPQMLFPAINTFYMSTEDNKLKAILNKILRTASDKTENFMA